MFYIALLSNRADDIHKTFFLRQIRHILQGKLLVILFGNIDKLHYSLSAPSESIQVFDVHSIKDVVRSGCPRFFNMWRIQSIDHLLMVSEILRKIDVFPILAVFISARQQIKSVRLFVRRRSVLKIIVISLML